MYLIFKIINLFKLTITNMKLAKLKNNIYNHLKNKNINSKRISLIKTNQSNNNQINKRKTHNKKLLLINLYYQTLNKQQIHIKIFKICNMSILMVVMIVKLVIMIPNHNKNLILMMLNELNKYFDYLIRDLQLISPLIANFAL